MNEPPFSLHLGRDEAKASLRIDVLGYCHPDVAEPHGFDLLEARAHAWAPPVRAGFDLSIRAIELVDLRAYLEEINSGNGPESAFVLGEGLLHLSFAPSRRGPVLCAVLLKSIDVSHARLEYLVTLEPAEITRALGELAALESPAE